MLNLDSKSSSDKTIFVDEFTKSDLCDYLVAVSLRKSIEMLYKDLNVSIQEGMPRENTDELVDDLKILIGAYNYYSVKPHELTEKINN